MKTYQKEIVYLSRKYDVNTNEWKMEPVKKQVSFFELDQTDGKQHRLIFMFAPLFQEIKTVGGGVNIIADPNVLYDLTIKAVEILLLTDDSFKDVDKKEFLQDGFALLEFGRWFLSEKYTPFFLNSMQPYAK